MGKLPRKRRMTCDEAELFPLSHQKKRGASGRNGQIEVVLRLFTPGGLAGSGKTYALRRVGRVVDNRQGSQL